MDSAFWSFLLHSCSLWDYTDVVMNYLCGPYTSDVGSGLNHNWLQYFDIVITGRLVSNVPWFLILLLLFIISESISPLNLVTTNQSLMKFLSVRSQVSFMMITVQASLKLSLILENFWMLIFRLVNLSIPIYLHGICFSLIYSNFRADWKPKIKSSTLNTSSESLPGTYFPDV